MCDIEQKNDFVFRTEIPSFMLKGVVKDDATSFLPNEPLSHSHQSTFRHFDPKVDLQSHICVAPVWHDVAVRIQPRQHHHIVCPNRRARCLAVQSDLASNPMMQTGRFAKKCVSWPLPRRLRSVTFRCNPLHEPGRHSSLYPDQRHSLSAWLSFARHLTKAGIRAESIPSGQGGG